MNPDDVSEIDLEMGIEDGYEQMEDLDIVSAAQSDLFLTNLYKYFIGRGFRNIIVTQIVSLSLVTFLVLFCIWLFSCIRFEVMLNMRDPSKVYHISEIIDWTGLSHMHWYLVISLILFCTFFVWKVVRIGYDIQKMRETKRFYNVHLEITDFELATIRWQKVVERLKELQSQQQFYLGKDDFNMHNVANHVLKKENYLVAMFNKEIFDFTIPYIKMPFFTKTMEWNIQYAIVNYLFDDRMKLKKEFLDYDKREELSHGIKQRLTLMAVLNIVLAPFLGLFLIFWGVFERGQEFYKTPSKLSSRRWSHLAKWKFREFNEFPHVFYERMKLSTKYADEYLKQFPNYWLSDLSKLAAFIISTMLFVMFIGMFFNDIILFNLELGADKSVFWWMGVLSTSLLIVRGFIRESYIFYPEKKLKKVADYIHYIPEEWVENAARFRVKYRFLQLYEYRIFVMLKELFGIIVNPIMMLTRLRSDTLNIVDFVRDYTMQHPELGYVCQFSVFEYTDDPMMNSQRLTRLNNDLRQNKLEKSMFYFNQNTFTPQASLIDTSFFMDPTVRPPPSSLSNNGSPVMQATLSNMNDMSFTPTINPSGVTQASVMLKPSRVDPVSQSVFLPPALTRMSNVESRTFNSGHLLDDLEAEEEKEQNSEGGPNMMDVFVGKSKKLDE